MKMKVSRRHFLAQATAACAIPHIGWAASGAKVDKTRLVLLSDTHITPKETSPWQREGMKRCINEILAMQPRPANVIIYGDLAYLVGNPEEYVLLKELLKPLAEAGIAWHPVMGNHDRRKAFYDVFAEFRGKSPVEDRVVSIVETPQADFILLDSCLAASDAVGGKGPVQGAIDDTQMAWLREVISKYQKPVFVGAHHSLSETKVGQLLLSNPQVVGYIHGHHHAWNTVGKFPALPQLCLPSTGHWGDIGYTMVDLAGADANFTLVQHDYYTPRPAAKPEDIKPEWKARVKRNQGAKWQQKCAPKTDGYVPLFNGRDLGGWVPCNVAPESFFVRDGLLITSGQPIGTMRTEKMYENFIIDFEWRHLTSGGNSGLFIWASGLPAVGSAFASGVEIQVLDNGYNAKGKNEWYSTHGDIFPVNGTQMVLAGKISPSKKRSFPMEERSKPMPQWNHYRLVANNGDLSLSVNGKEVTIAQSTKPRKGYLMLESEGGECHFRNIRIKELPSTGVKPAETAEGADGFLPIFTGLDLRGWQAGAAAWRVEKDEIRSQGAGEPLWSERAYASFDLVADLKVKSVGGAEAQGVVLRDGSGKVVPLAAANLEADKWRRLTASIRPGGDYGNGPWQLGLSGGGSDSAWRNLFLRTI